MSTVWNPSDITSNIALSSGNHVATSTGGGNNGARAFGVGHLTGKWYLEYSSILSGGGSGRYGLGALSDGLGGSGTLGVDPGGFLHGSGGTTNMGAVPDGHTLGLAVDFDDMLLWATLDGSTWTGDGNVAANPNTLAHGLSIAGITSSLLPMTWLQNNPGHCTLNCGDSAFTFSVPTNFLGWDVPVPFRQTQGTLMC